MCVIFHFDWDRLEGVCIDSWTHSHVRTISQMQNLIKINTALLTMQMRVSELGSGAQWQRDVDDAAGTWIIAMRNESTTETAKSIANLPTTN